MFDEFVERHVFTGCGLYHCRDALAPSIIIDSDHQDVIDGRAVSYTHLTLPTILRV